MKKETEEAIVKIGKLAENITYIPKAVVISFAIVFGLFILFVVVIPATMNYFECGEFNPNSYTCVDSLPPASAIQIEIGMVECYIDDNGYDRWLYFNYGWEEVKAYADLNPDANIIRCW